MPLKLKLKLNVTKPYSFIKVVERIEANKR